VGLPPYDSITPPAPPGVDDTGNWELERVDRALAGSTEAFRALVERYHHGLYRLGLRMLGDQAEAEDVVQETFTRAYKRLDGFDSNYRLSTWLYRIALNICRDHLKSPRRKEQPRVVDSQFPPSGESAPRADKQVESARMAERVHNALARLSPSYREIIVLKDLQEMSYPEIREITGTPVTALKIRAIRARAKLREVLEHEGADEPT
jgi:RNA polymerase sigma-70 factor (ECF subfamily)